jgi:hypothetical protein
MRFRPRHSVLVALAVLAGCGGSTVEQPATPTPQAPEPEATATAAAKVQYPQPCSDAVKAVVKGATTRVTAISWGMATCVYSTPGQRVDVQVDNNPQVPFRFERAVVERGQNAAWTHTPSKAPVEQHGVSDGPWGGANWFPADEELLGTDGKYLVSVHFVKSPLKRRAELALASRMMEAQLPNAR